MRGAGGGRPASGGDPPPDGLAIADGTCDDEGRADDVPVDSGIGDDGMGDAACTDESDEAHHYLNDGSEGSDPGEDVRGLLDGLSDDDIGAGVDYLGGDAPADGHSPASSQCPTPRSDNACADDAPALIGDPPATGSDPAPPGPGGGDAPQHGSGADVLGPSGDGSALDPGSSAGGAPPPPPPLPGDPRPARGPASRATATIYINGHRISYYASNGAFEATCANPAHREVG
eukprot:4009816-Pyramimonas_sp.AAC.1